MSQSCPVSRRVLAVIRVLFDKFVVTDVTLVCSSLIVVNLFCINVQKTKKRKLRGNYKLCYLRQISAGSQTEM